MKEWRDQQISELLSLGPNRNQIQEEQLRALKLEKEFERRAQEEEEEEEDEDQVKVSPFNLLVTSVDKIFAIVDVFSFFEC